MALTTLPTESVYKEKRQPIKSGGKRSKDTWQSNTGYLAIYPWIHCKVSLDTFSGHFSALMPPVHLRQQSCRLPACRESAERHGEALPCPCRRGKEGAGQQCGQKNAARCDGQRNAVHRPSERAAYAHAPLCAFGSSRLRGQRFSFFTFVLTPSPAVFTEMFPSTISTRAPKL